MVADFAVIDSCHGRFIVNRHCAYQAETLIKAGATHIEDELSKIFVIVDRLETGSIIVDGGANAGFFTIPVANRVRGRDIRLLSFEPQRRIFSGLAGSVVLNDLHHVSVFNLALGSAHGWTQIPEVDYGVPQDFGMVQLGDPSDASKDYLDPRQCEIVALDDMSLPRLDFVKLDVEGYEISALQGGRRSIEKYRPWIWIEYFIIGKDKIQQELDYLQDYDFHVMDYQNLLCVPRERLAKSGIIIAA